MERYSDEFSRQNGLVQVRKRNKSKTVKIEIERITEYIYIYRYTLGKNHTIKDPSAKC